jgi:hypothetical protein
MGGDVDVVIKQMVGGRLGTSAQYERGMYRLYCLAYRTAVGVSLLSVPFPRRRKCTQLAALKKERGSVKRNGHRTMLLVIDDMTSQDYIRKFCQMRRLSHDDVKIEWLAWLVVLVLFITAILETGCSYQILF